MKSKHIFFALFIIVIFSTVLILSSQKKVNQENNPKFDYHSVSTDEVIYFSDEKLFQYASNSDGAYAETSANVLYSRFIDSPIKERMNKYCCERL